MPAHPKLTPSRQRRFFAILSLGEPLTAAARAINVSPQAIRKRAQADPVFAAKLNAARPSREPVSPVDDWRQAAEWLERTDPLRWALPELDLEA